MSDTTSPRDDQDPDSEDAVDQTIEETFPASDPPSTGGSTGPNDPNAPPAP